MQSVTTEAVAAPVAAVSDPTIGDARDAAAHIISLSLAINLSSWDLVLVLLDAHIQGDAAVDLDPPAALSAAASGRRGAVHAG
jgi:hypothetical protein